MSGQGHTNRTSSPSRVRKALESVFLGNSGGTVVEECRRCGTSLESETHGCPTCGAEEVARYRIE
ncbi:hypothetical protein [Haloterrigena alkaliphila]|uniref:Small CPxCG-related zinc finger protein n=1 Tax=Haloterrigena alkaliphila TaxID=2816475 RepID=A0A8A2VDV2_9EURY|nr:hypothetical protein [Haloterrigena alkaliphila]QSW98857.1 hypothetical protein J0X25_15925 [Haloterrigena alkaliphila]